MQNEITEKEFLAAQNLLVNAPVQLFCSMAGKGFCPYEYDNGKCKSDGKCTNHICKIKK